MQRTHRQNNYWEPTYQPENDPLKNKINWSDLKNNNGPNECICEEFSLEDIGSNFIEKRKFRTCDFTGDFGFEKTFSFKKCIFNNCHFGWSNWENIKFQECEFINCAFGLTIFKRCQFLTCKFKNISVSSNETVFENCILDNPKKFISNIRTNVKNIDALLEEKGTTKQYQLLRLSLSKAKIAKNILLTLKDYGDEDLFISSVKVFSDQYTRSKLKQSIYFIQKGNWKQRVLNFLSFFPRLLELIIIGLFGRLNKWGYGIGRILIIGFFVWLFFGCIYSIKTHDLIFSYTKSFDILTLVGYSKYSLNYLDISHRIIQIFNLIIGLSWFSLLFPTILARITYRFD